MLALCAQGSAFAEGCPAPAPRVGRPITERQASLATGSAPGAEPDTPTEPRPSSWGDRPILRIPSGAESLPGIQDLRAYRYQPKNAALYSILRFYHAPRDRSITAKRYLDVPHGPDPHLLGMALGVQRIASETRPTPVRQTKGLRWLCNLILFGSGANSSPGAASTLISSRCPGRRFMRR